MSKNNNLLDIADLLIKIKAERELHENDIPPSITARYSKNNIRGIYIDGDKYIVVNSDEAAASTQKEEVNELKDKGTKYNLDFYLSTHDFDEPNVIDEEHNKGKLINLAYSEVSFLTKDIESQVGFDRKEATNVVKKSIKGLENKDEFDECNADINTRQTSKEYDEVYRCRCVFTDISSNESTESLYIKAVKTSKTHYEYEVIDSGDLKDQFELLEKNNSEDKKRLSYSTISPEEYQEIKKHIQDGIYKYFYDNNKKFFRLIRVEVKAIYCLRLQKTPINIIFKKNTKPKGRMSSYYSTIAGDFNVFSCPQCGASRLSNGKELRIHFDNYFLPPADQKEGDDDDEFPIGCGECMEKCERCGEWHFKLNKIKDVLEDDSWDIKKSKRFISKWIDKEGVSSTDFCSCRENLTWAYDEMGKLEDIVFVENGEEKTEPFSDTIINDFLGKDRLVFVNFNTGELIAKYSDFVDYFQNYMLNNKDKELLKLYRESSSVTDMSQNKEERIYNFVRNKRNYKNKQRAVEDCIEKFKIALSHAFNVPSDSIKITNKDNIMQCECCGGWYYALENTNDELYFNNNTNKCCCCEDGLAKNWKLWTRLEDGVTYYRPKLKEEKVIRTFQSKKEEVLYSKWMNQSINIVIKKHKEDKTKAKEEK